MSMLTGRGLWPRALMAVLAVVIAVGFTACGDDDEGQATTTEMEAPANGNEATISEENGITIVEIPMPDRGLAFAVTEVTVPAGQMTLRSVNPQPLDHNIAIDAPDPVEGAVVRDGGVSEVTVTLEPGTYEYYWSVPGHREGGMVGTLIVQ